MRVVVTGGAGFIGANLCRTLVERGVDVTVIDDLSTGSVENLRGVDVDLRVGSVLDRSLVAAVVAGADSVVHLAALASVPLSIERPLETHEVNATGTLHVLEAARAAGANVVVASSAAVYGDDRSPRKSETLPTRPLSPYASTKVAAEAYVSCYRRAYGLPALAFRFFNVFGPLQPPSHVYAAAVPAFVAAALARRPVTIYGDGRQTRDFVYVGTVATLLAETALGRVSCESPVNVALGRRTSLLDLLELIENVVGHSIARRHEPPRPGDVRDSQADDALLQSLFPQLAAVPLEVGLAQTVAWFQSLPTAARKRRVLRETPVM